MNHRHCGIKAFNPKCKAALAVMGEACRRAAALGLRLHYQTPLSFGRTITPTLHVMIDASGSRVLDWWPSPHGTWRAPGGQRGTVPDLLALVELAAGEILDERPFAAAPPTGSHRRARR